MFFLHFYCFFVLFFYNPPRPSVFIILTVQYFSVICRPSDHTVGRSLAEIRTRDGRSTGRHTNENVIVSRFARNI